MRNSEVSRHDPTVGRRLQLITGWALFVGAAGVFIDAWVSWGDANGSFGLIPAYLGFATGMTGFALVVYKTCGSWPGLFAGAGVVGMVTAWGNYPDYSTIGGLGGILIGIAVLWLPGWARFASPLWVASGLMGITELVRPSINWGPIAGFTLVGAALAATGAFVLWGRPSRELVEQSVQPVGQAED